MNERYEKIIGLPHHVSENRVSMSRLDRAAQFAPYSALSGYEDAVEETARLTERKIELEDDEKERINSTLVSLLSASIGTKAKITYFRPDSKKTGGVYITLTDEIGRIEENERKIMLLCGKTIHFDDIIELQKIDTF